MRSRFTSMILMMLVWMIPVSHVVADTLAMPQREPGSGTSQPRAAPVKVKPGKHPPDPSNLSITDYYNRASIASDPALPDGLRIARWSRPGSHGKNSPVINSQCLRFAPGEFSRLFLRSPYARRLRELFVEQGADVGKITNLLTAHGAGGDEIISIFDEGYLILFDHDEKTAYIFPAGKGMGERVFGLIR